MPENGLSFPGQLSRVHSDTQRDCEWFFNMYLDRIVSEMPNVTVDGATKDYALDQQEHIILATCNAITARMV